MDGLFEKLKQYVDNDLGGMEALGNLPDPKAAFVPFIRKGLDAGDRYQALLGCMLQAYVNSCVENGSGILANGTLEMMLSGNSPRPIGRDARSFQYLFDAFASNDPAFTYSAADRAAFAESSGIFFSQTDIVDLLNVLLKEYDASPFKDKAIAIIGNEIPFPEALAAKVFEYNDDNFYLNPAMASKRAQAFDAVLDCNVSSINSDNALIIPQLCAKITKAGGIIVHDMRFDSRHEYPDPAFGDDETLGIPAAHERLGQEVLALKPNDMIVVRQTQSMPLPFERFSSSAANALSAYSWR